MATQTTDAVSTGIPGGALIGRIIEVQSSGMTAVLLDDEEGHAPTVTLGDEDVLVGQTGHTSRCANLGSHYWRWSRR